MMMNKEINTKAMKTNELEQVSGGLHGPLEAVEKEKEARIAEKMKNLMRNEILRHY